MRTAFFMAVLFLALGLLIQGCALRGGGIEAKGINWALRENGGKVMAFSEDPNYPASTLNDGVTVSENWEPGEGWQARIFGFGAGQGGMRGRGGPRAGQREGNWVMVEFREPVTIGHVRIHTIDSDRYPATKYGVRDLLVQYEDETSLGEKVWASVDKYGKRVGSKDNIVRDNVKGVIDVRFTPVRTQRIRIIIYGTNDMPRPGRRNRSSSENGGVVRITEIEAFGT